MAPPSRLVSILINQVSNSVVLLSYNRPNSANSFTPQQYDGLREALVWARKQPAAKVVVVAGKGKHFCAGRAMGGTDDIAAEVAAGNKAFWELRNCPKILIAAVHGASIGWGCTQLANFDLVYAHQDAFFETPFMALGLVPEAGSSLVLPREMGKTRANALLLAGERLSAQDAYIGGLITAVVQAPTLNEFHVKTLGKATRMGGYSAEALRLGKKLIADAADDAEALARAGERESRDLIMLASRPETQAILQSFGGKKKGKL